MEFLRKRISLIKEPLFIIASMMELVIGILDYCNVFIPGSRFVLWGLLLVYILIIFSNHYSKKEWVTFMVFALLVGVIQYLCSGVNMGLKLIVYLFALKEIDLRLLGKWILTALGGTMALVLLLGLLGRLPLFQIDSTGKGFEGIRFTFGFPYCNAFMLNLFALFGGIEVFCLGSDIAVKRRRCLEIFLGILYIIAFIMTRSYTGGMLGAFFVCLLFGVRIIHLEKWEWPRVLLIIGFVIIIFVNAISIFAARYTRSLEDYLSDIDISMDEVEPCKDLKIKNTYGFIYKGQRDIKELVNQGSEYIELPENDENVLLIHTDRESSFLNIIDRMCNGRVGELSVQTYSKTGERYTYPQLKNWSAYSSANCQNNYDLGYVQLFYRWGVIPALSIIIFVMVSLVMGSEKVWKGRDELMIFVICLSTYMFMEPFMIDNFVPMNYWFISSAVLFWSAWRRGVSPTYFKRRLLAWCEGEEQEVEEKETKALTVSHVSVSYRILNNISVRKTFLRKKVRDEIFEAVKDVSFELADGEILGIIGKNGSGKSTLLKCVAGVFSPNSGSIDLHGRTVSLMSLGVGFKNELSGRENIVLSGMLLGFSEEEIRKKVPEIIEFAEIGDFIDKPVRTYSSGMHSKLAFSITAMLETDIMLVDEVLSVGDERFRKKSLAKMRELISDSHRTVVIVSHSIETLKEFCNKVLWIHEGETKMIGEPETVLREYMKFMQA